MTHFVFEEATNRATAVIKSQWKGIAEMYTLGWMNPLGSVERKFPFISSAVNDVAHKVNADLPIFIYLTRQTPPESAAVAVPYTGLDGNPYNCRLTSSTPLTPDRVRALNDFAQAAWFLIGTDSLPHPKFESGGFEKSLVELTDQSLLTV